MQAMPVTAVAQIKPGNAAQSSVQGGEGAAIEGSDFSALLVAQIKGGGGAESDARLLLDAQILDPALAGVAVSQDSKLLPGEELALNDGLIPLPGAFLAVPAIVESRLVSPVLTSAPFGKAEINGAHDVLNFSKNESPKLDAASLEMTKFDATSQKSVREAEFAAGGKVLPQNRLEKGGVAMLPAELQRLPEIPVNFSPVMMVASQSSVIETKALPLSAAVLQAPLGTAGWGDALGQKVVWMAGQQTQVAELHLNPPNLGPMEVRLSISNDQVSALFVSHQPAVREAIEAAMPRLREMFADSGMSLGNATVSSDSLPQQQSPDREGHSGSSRHSDFSVMGNDHPSRFAGGAISLRLDGSGMVDLFA